MTSGLSGRRILVVEDEVMVAWALEDMLAGLVARVKKLRTKLMVGDLRGTEVVFVVVGMG